MKKVIKLTESDLMRIVKRVIKENEDQSGINQSEIDKVMDKIKKYGEHSLTFRDKQILDFPHSDYTFEGGDNVHKFISLLTKNKLVNPDDLHVYDENEVSYSTSNEFDDSRNIIFVTDELEDGIIKVIGDDLQTIDIGDDDLGLFKMFRKVKKWEQVLGLNFIMDI